MLLLVCLAKARGDEIETVNGDRYVGRFVALGAQTITVESDVLGTVKLPREKVAVIRFSRIQSAGATNSMNALPPLLHSNVPPRVQGMSGSNPNADLSAVLKQISRGSNLVQQVQQQILGGAGPEAQAKFNDLLGGLLSGKMDLNDLRLEARSTLAQARNGRKELGEDAGSSLDGYLAILEGFLKETEPATSATNSSGPRPSPQP